MSVVMVTNRRASTRWEGYHGFEPTPAWLVGIVARTRPVRLVAMVAIVCAASVTAAGLTPSPGGRAGGGGAGAAVAAGPGLPVVPLGAVGPISAVLGRDLPGYRVVGLTATNAEQALRAEFSSRGVTVVSGRLRLGIALDGYGYALASGAVPPIAPVAPVAGANRVLYAHGALSEWWANGPAGLEQGFTVSSAPGLGSGPLTFSLALSGNLRARLDGGGLYLSGPGGALSYDDLAATDARGRALIEVDDRGAAYPVRVDPLVRQSGELISSDGTPSGEFGRSVAVSGNTVAVAADNQTGGSIDEEGAVYVFVEPTDGWSDLMAQTAELLASWRPPPWAAATGYQNAPGLGWALAMSGPTIVATSILTCNKWGPTVTSPCLNEGAAYVFVEPTTGWRGVLHQSALLTASNLSPRTTQLPAGELGFSVAVSGSTVAVGAAQRVGSISSDAVYVFEEPAAGWSGPMTQDAELAPADPANNELFGGGLAVSGNTIVVGAPGVGAPFGGRGEGAAYVFQAPAGGWSGTMTQSAGLTAPSGTGIDELGASVAVSGNTVAVGAPLETVGPNTGQGAVFVYNEPAAGWSGALAPAAELTASDGTGDNSFGTVAVSGNSIAVLESSRNPGSLNGALLFSEPAAGWSGHLTESSELVASNEAVTDAFGSDVALSCTTVVVGAPGHHRLGSFAGAQGSAYVFAPPTTTSEAEGRQAAVVPSTAAASCPLAVTFTVLSPQEAGLSYVGAAAKSNTSAQYSQSAAFFREFATPTSAHLLGGGTRLDGCLSGCIDVLVQVKNSAGQPVDGADLYASVTQMHATLLDVPGFLCGQEIATVAEQPQPICGENGFQDLKGLKTNSSGQALLRYWVPGIIEAHKVVLTVTASAEPGCKNSCRAGSKSPATSITLNVQPHVLVADAQATLSPSATRAIADWANPPTVGDIVAGGPGAALGSLVNDLLTTNGSTSSIPGLPGAVKWALTVRDTMTSMKASEKFETDSLLLLFVPLGIQGLGLDDESRSAAPPAKPLNSNMLDLISSSSLENRAQQWLSAINPLPVTLSPLGVESSHKAGLLWDFGKFARSNFDDGHPWAADLEVDDVSYCDQALEVESPAAACGPGYAHLNNDVPTGVRPYLYLKFTLTALTAIGHKTGVVFTRAFVVPYNATAWLKAQFGAKPM